jgi:hypothetical protein
MPLAAALGRGGPEFESAAWTLPSLQPERVAVIGARDLDRGERDLIAELDLAVHSMSALDRRGIEAIVGEALERASQFFEPLKRSFVFWVREGESDLEELCRSRQMELVEPDGLPELFLEGPPPALKQLPDNVELRRTTDPDVRRDYVNVVAEGWGMGGISTELASEIFFHPDSMGDPNVIAFVAYVDGRPASGCMALLAHGIAVGGNGATVPWARRQGLAEACYAACLQVAYDDFGIRGSVCQSSPSGAGVWARMGYQPLTHYLRFIGKPDVTAWE